MKRLLAICLTLILALMPAAAWGAPDVEKSALPFDVNAKAALLIEPTSGMVVMEHNADEMVPVASITKIMTMLLVCEALERDRISVDDMITVSRNAASQPGSEAFLDANASYTLSELFKAVVIGSANDAAVALAEHLYGSESEFVTHMNARARDLGLENVRFGNCTGLPADGHGMSARSIAVLAAMLVDKPLFKQYSTVWMDTLTHPSGRVTELVNTNRLVRFYEGTEGVKTGSTNEAGFCVAAAASREGMRLIAVVLGASNSNVRFNLAQELLSYGFDHYHMSVLYKAGQAVQPDVAVKGLGSGSVDIVSSEDIRSLVKKGEEERLRVEVELPEELSAPIYSDKPVGEIVLYKGNTELKRYYAYPGTDVTLPGFLEKVRDIMGGWMLSRK